MSRIWVPKFKVLEAQDAIVLAPRMKGRYKLAAVRGGTVQRETPWFDNLILNQGLDLIASTASIMSSAHVGTGTTTPAVTQTALTAQVAASTNVTSASRTINTSSPYEMTSTVTIRFAQGAAAGNLTEIGVGTGATLFSRALIVDGGGSPTTFPVAADEYLDVTYQIIVYPPLGDSTGTVSITGSGSHGYVARAAALPAGWNNVTGGGPLAVIDNVNFAAAYSGGLGAITGLPSGSSSGAASRTNDAYTPGAFSRTASISFGLGEGNVGGIASTSINWGTTASVSINERTLMRFQYSYSPVIDKTSAKLLTLPYSIAWARV